MSEGFRERLFWVGATDRSMNLWELFSREIVGRVEEEGVIMGMFIEGVLVIKAIERDDGSGLPRCFDAWGRFRGLSLLLKCDGGLSICIGLIYFHAKNAFKHGSALT